MVSIGVHLTTSAKVLFSNAPYADVELCVRRALISCTDESNGFVVATKTVLFDILDLLLVCIE